MLDSAGAYGGDDPGKPPSLMMNGVRKQGGLSMIFELVGDRTVQVTELAPDLECPIGFEAGYFESFLPLRKEPMATTVPRTSPSRA